MATKTIQDKSARYQKSTFYEQLVEHAFISELLQEAWFRYGKTVEVLRSEIDSSGYDLLLECNGIIRHVELKTSGLHSRTSSQKVNMALGQKPSGCVIWIIREEDESRNRVGLRYLFFGNLPGEPLPSIEHLRIAKQTRGDSHGVKKLRPAMRKVPKSKFIEVSGINELLGKLFALSEA